MPAHGHGERIVRERRARVSCFRRVVGSPLRLFSSRRRPVSSAALPSEGLRNRP